MVWDDDDDDNEDEMIRIHTLEIMTMMMMNVIISNTGILNMKQDRNYGTLNIKYRPGRLGWWG